MLYQLNPFFGWDLGENFDNLVKMYKIMENAL